MNTDNQSQRTALASADGEIVVERAVSYQGGSAILDPSRMDPGTPYVFTLEGIRFVLFKRDNGALDVYYLPEST